MNVRYRFQK